ncbi:FKBP-type peptidyl-prolyl cis-trans isomerase [Sphingomonas segetis]|jgi:peptidylprolyl isomerase/FKBP-type peptidyl-prolyl cis-trans isomerase FklB|uniref:FKBP-type peptidyl-prolyl cis-trans isomerase n=1 Tax=Sphingomonas segetis TaxID=1104779 RepID=UPI0012D308B4|nr:FKBP-type peptidyl-prolyl cis-trans isomerase [Sphingomonas segetis]
MIRTLLMAAATIGIAAAAPAASAAPPVPPATPAGPNFLAQNAAAKGVVTTSSGLQYFVVVSGPTTGPHPTAEDMVSFDYEVKLLTGETIDSSYERGEPLTGKVGAFVPGFTEALQLMRQGDEWIVWVPPQLGYGDKDSGPVPANSVLRFRLALHSITPAG